MRTLLLLAGSIFSAPLLAQTACPQGAVAGSAVCGPAPSYGGGDAEPQTSEYVPAGRWHSRWGAVAMDREMGRSGAASDMVTGDQAEAEAFLQCQKLKTAKCKVDIVYANACVAMAWPVEGGFVINRVGKDLDSAVSDAMKQCKAKNGGACIIKYTDCSMPSFDRF